MTEEDNTATYIGTSDETIKLTEQDAQQLQDLTHRPFVPAWKYYYTWGDTGNGVDIIYSVAVWSPDVHTADLRRAIERDGAITITDLSGGLRTLVARHIVGAEEVGLTWNGAVWAEHQFPEVSPEGLPNLVNRARSSANSAQPVNRDQRRRTPVFNLTGLDIS